MSEKMYAINIRENKVGAVDYHDGIEVYKTFFFRKENAVPALALIRAFEDMVAKDREQHEQDLREAQAHREEQDSKVIMAMDILTEGIRLRVREFSGEEVRNIGALLCKPVRYGELEITPHLKIVRSYSDSDKHYAVTPNGCSCPDHVYRKRTCKHMQDAFPED